MDVRLVALVVKLFVEERLELFAKLLLSDQFNHSRQVHRRTPAILPACSLIESVALHLGVGLIDILELLRPDAVEDFLASASPLVGICRPALLFCQLSESPEVAARFKALVGTLQAESLHLCNHAWISIKKRGDADALTIGVEKRGYGMFCADSRYAFIVRAPILLPSDVKLCQRLHDVGTVSFIEECDERELRAIGVPKRPGTIVLEAFRLVHLIVCAEVARHVAIRHLERAVECPVERGVEDGLLVCCAAFNLDR